MVRYRVAHGMFALVENNASRWASVSLYRGAPSDEFRASDLGTLDFLIPHIQRAFKVHFQFAELQGTSNKRRNRDRAEYADHTGLIFLGATGEVVLMNRRA